HRSGEQSGLKRRRERQPRPLAPEVPIVRPPGSPPDAVVLQFLVPPELAGLRLDRFVQVRMPRLSRTRAQAIVRASAYRADGERRRPADIVRGGEIVILVRDRFAEPITPLHFDVLHEDDAIMVIDKPAGLPMHPTATYHKHTLSYLLGERYGIDGAFVPRIAHRLDRETSGAVLCGKTLDAERILKRSFERHLVEKSYLAIVRGELNEDGGEIDLSIASVKEGLHVLMEVRSDGLTALTRYEVKERIAGYSLLALYPRSGRQHQLRVHLAAIGHPIVGDKLYGPEREAPFLEYIETGMTAELEARLGHDRQALHAHTLSFMHPVRHDTFAIAAPFATDLQTLWSRLRGAC
ncbi:MAG TPA: RluA family pseudouridine synthase, partial [Polyangiales bacterium]|nr:RluA family pseudouridine synthase [Polyangiales bacterium]